MWPLVHCGPENRADAGLPYRLVERWSGWVGRRQPPRPGAWGGEHLWHCWDGGGRSFESVVYEIIYELTRAGVCIIQALTASAFHLPPFVQLTPQPGTFLELVALADPHFQFSFRWFVSSVFQTAMSNTAGQTKLRISSLTSRSMSLSLIFCPLLVCQLRLSK